ncbi:MAG: HEAT repeat domain-containing protein [Gemmatimonadales bacterium]|nr:HEAT repeat domain-containing protein [Gemmatimonadales bacterium]
MRADGDPIHTAAVHAAGVIMILCLAVAGPLAAQGARASEAAFARGKPLGEWLAQADHYIPELRREAVKAIATLGPGARAALPTLLRAARDEHQEVRYWAIEAIRRIGPDARDAAPVLLTVLADDVRPVQQVARRALEALGPPATPLLLPSLGSRDAWVRANAAEAIGVIGAAPGKTVRQLALLLADDSLWVRASAAWALGHLGRAAKPATRPLIDLLQEELRHDPTLADPAQRARVENLCYALGRIGKDAGDAVPALLSVFFDGGDSLRSVAVAALAGVGNRAAEPLGKAARSGPMAVRLDAAQALRLMGPEGRKAVPDLVKVLEGTDELEGGHDLVIAVADALGAMGKSARPALGVLERQRRKSVSPDVVAALDRALRKARLGG